MACIALSRQYALKIDVDALETVGRAQLALGKGLDSIIMSEHMSVVRRVGFRAALHELSLTLLARTLQPRTPFLGTPPPRHTPLPTAPHQTLVPTISTRESEVITAHQQLVVVAPHGPLDGVTEMTQTTLETLEPYSEGISLGAKLHFLAVHGD